MWIGARVGVYELLGIVDSSVPAKEKEIGLREWSVKATTKTAPVPYNGPLFVGSKDGFLYRPR